MEQPTISLSGDWQGDRPPLQKWGPFDLLERVGQGGFGEVYRAFDPALQRVVAVKLLLSEANGPDDEAAILRESRAMARVIHPNVVPIYGVQTYDGRVGFWSAFVRGRTLSALLASNGPFGPGEVVHIGVDLCRALAAVHAAGLLHRDIKAGNAMREEGGRILLMDFGLTQERGGHTHFGGTPGYIAPELRAGKPATVRSDIYALGVLLYHLLTGAYPAEDAGATWHLLDQRPDLPPELVRAIHTAIDPDPEARFGSAAQMAAGLSNTEVSGGQVFAPPAPPPPAPVFGRAKRWVAAAVVLACAAAGAYLLHSRGHATGTVGGNSVQARYGKAHSLLLAYYRPGSLATATPMLESVTRDDPSFAPAWADLGRANYLLFSQNRDTKYVDPARQDSLQAITADPDEVSAHVTLGMLYTLLGNNELALHELDAAEAVDKSDAEVWGARAELYRQQGHNEKVEPALRQAMQLAPSDWRWPKLLADYEERSGHGDDAIRTDQDALRLSPDNPRILNNLGLYLRAAGRLEEARAALRRATDIEPDYIRYSNLGGVERDLGDHAAAEEAFQKAIALNPADYRAWEYLADLYERDHADPARVAETYRKSIALGQELLKTEPRNTSLLADIGVMYASVGDSARGLPLVRQAAALDPDNGEILFNAGVACELMKRRADAIGWIGAALRHGYPLKSVEQAPELSELRRDKKYLALVASLR